MSTYYAIVAAIARAVSKILVVLLVALVSVVFANIVLRYFGRSLRWSDEVARLLFVWTAFLGIFLGYNADAHPAFTQIVTMVGARSAAAGRIMVLMTHLLVCAFVTIVLYGGIVYIRHAAIQTTAILRISVGWMYAAAPFSMALLLLEAVRKILLLFDRANDRATPR